MTLARKVEGGKDDPGFRDSWSQYKVIKVSKRQRVTVESLEVRALASTSQLSRPLKFHSMLFL